jgi:hypothetical protein
MIKKLVEKAATEVANKYGGTKQDINSFVTIMEFLDEFQNLTSITGVKHDLNTFEFYLAVAEKFFSKRFKSDVPKIPATESDEMVSYILQIYFGYSEPETEKIKLEHKLSMAAENKVGELLERYIGLTLEGNGWVWCSGHFIKAVDMIKRKSDGTWVLLQVKNRSNSENSSSSAIRIGTEIKKWFRTFANKKTTNWNAFPDEEMRHLLSEDGFKTFVKNYLLSSKKSTK